MSPLLLTYAHEKITNAISIESLLRSKLNYDNSEWTEYDYNKVGVILNTSSMVSVICNFNLPQLLFFL